MKSFRALLLALPILGAMGLPVAAADPDGSVLAYHGHPDRSGSFVVPSLTWERARSLHPDPAFHTEISGHIYAQPLYWRAAGSPSGVLLVATEDNTVYALDAPTGKEVWKRSLGQPVARSALPCGNIDPLGITGTPVIDEATQAVYLDAMVADASGAHHRIFALALKDGAILPGWPVDVADALNAQGHTFNPREQNQRGALTIAGGAVYVPFGGHFGDCGGYHGWVVGVRLRNPRDVFGWHTRARGGGIWAPAGIVSDGRSLYVATGNTFGANNWSDGEAVIRLPPDLNFSEQPRDFFAPRNWRDLDGRDADLGGTAPLPLDVAGSAGAQQLMLALGKDRNAYLLDRDNLGGIGGELREQTVAARAIITAPATYPAPDGTIVVFQGDGANCPSESRGSGVTALKVQQGSPPIVSTAWCGAVSGRGSPIVTTTNGRSDPIVWILGAEGDDRLHGFRGDTGEPLFAGPTMRGLRHFQTLIATEDRLYVATDGDVHAFGF